MEYLPTVVVAFVVAAAFIAIVANEIRNRVKGKHSCSCGCKNCSLNCHGCGGADKN